MAAPSLLDSLRPVPAAKRPTNQDIDLAPAAGATTDPRLVDKPVGEYDANRAKRVLAQPVFGKRPVTRSAGGRR